MRMIARMWLPLALMLTAGFAEAATLRSMEGISSTVMERHQSSFSGLALRARLEAPGLVPAFSIVPSIEYWRNKSTIQTFGIESTRKDATLAGLLRYDFARETWHPYIGAGLGLHFLSSEVNAPSLGLNEASDSVILGGFAALAGVEFGLAGRLSNLLELEYHHVSERSQLKFNWGLSVGF